MRSIDAVYAVVYLLLVSLVVVVMALIALGGSDESVTPSVTDTTWEFGPLLTREGS